MRCKACNKLLHPRWPIDRDLCAACFGAGTRQRDGVPAEGAARATRALEGRNMSFEHDSDRAPSGGDELVGHLGSAREPKVDS